jgi:hypothetical protein
MEQQTTKVNIIQQAEVKLETKKDLLRTAYLTYLETIKSGGVVQQRKAISNFISVAVAYLPEGKYTDPPHPDYFEFREKYFTHVKVLIPQQMDLHTPLVKELWEKEYLSLMEGEYRKVHKLLEQHTTIFDDKKNMITLGK